MIQISKSDTADSRTCDVTKVTRQTLLESSVQHIDDVRRGLEFFGAKLDEASRRHDTDKITDIDGFYANFQARFTEREWLDRHYLKNRHHLEEATGLRDDVNLIDVLDYIADNVMAGMGRSGVVRAMKLTPELLELAFLNTVALLKAEVVVEWDGQPMSPADYWRHRAEDAEARIANALA